MLTFGDTAIQPGVRTDQEDHRHHERDEQLGVALETERIEEEDPDEAEHRQDSRHDTDREEAVDRVRGCGAGIGELEPDLVDVARRRETTTEPGQALEQRSDGPVAQRHQHLLVPLALDFVPVEVAKCVTHDLAFLEPRQGQEDEPAEHTGDDEGGDQNRTGHLRSRSR